ncbi:MAG: M6 family metalloprotease domain-containing protein [Prevotellaceae bacterium]|jgi:M6 family metalloprotease-like protein|nr:M6 family metalloprotease domain-containing protein [Prevotellaceae bacterium]
MIRTFSLSLFTACCCGLLLFPAGLQAAPAEPATIRKVQPDGTEITIIQRGDEKVHWMETLDGYTLLYDAEQYVVYATTDPAGNLIPSNMRYPGDRPGAQAPAIDGTTPLQKGLRYSPAQVAVLRQLWEVAGTAQRAAPSPVTGTKKALCVLMQYPDMPMVKTGQDFDNLLNQVGYSHDGAVGSVRDFYYENSYGQMTLEITVAGPYTAAHNHNSYGDKSGSYGGADLAREAITAVSNDGSINLQDFANADNRLETFHMIFAGHGSEASGAGTDIWSHKWVLSSPLPLNGVTVYDYSCSPELRKATGTGITHVGVICHELCHVFGAPDYYDTDGGYGGSFLGTGNWDLMANGMWNGPDEASWGTVPAHINMFQKIQYGWVRPVELTGSQTITGMPNSASSPTAYVINTGSSGEQYILENRQRTGFDRQVPGHGLLIYHVHPSLLNSEGNTVNARHPQRLYPVCANAAIAKPNADPNSYGSINSTGCPFPGSSGKTYFTDATIPMSFSWTTGEGIQSPITGIAETDGRISFGYKQKSIPGFEFTLNHDESTTSKQTARLNFIISGDAPLSYKVSEDASRLNNTLWRAYSPSVTYTFESNNPGYKTVYTKLKNEIGETAVKSAVIYFKPIEKSNASAMAAHVQEGPVKIYPTAVETNLTVERDINAPPASITVISTRGTPYLTKKLTAPVETLDLSRCPAGILLIHLSDGASQITLPVLKL